MAEIWLAELPGRHGFRKRVVLKAMLPELAQRPMFRQMFLDEAMIASRIEHPNVAQVFDFGEVNGRLYIVMEWVDGTSAAQLERALRSRREQLPLSLALYITSELSGALHAVHELRDDEGNPLGVVHRDVSPENILFAKNGTVKLIDFGIVKTHCDGLSEEISAGGFKGKFRFAAPEQTLGLRVDRRADVWAVGAVLFRLLSQRAPFEYDGPMNPAGILAAYRECAPLPRSVPAGVAQIVARALAFSPQHRFDSCEELQEAVDLAIASERQRASRHDLAALVTCTRAASNASAPRQAVAEKADVSDDEPTRKLAVRGRLVAAVRARIGRRHGSIALSAVAIASIALLTLGTSLGSRRSAPNEPRAHDSATNFMASLGPIVTPAHALVSNAGAAGPSGAPCTPLAESNAVPVDRLPLESSSSVEKARGLAWHQPHRKQAARSFSVSKSRTLDVGF